MLLVIIEIRLEAEFALAELAGILTRDISPIGLFMPFEFNQFVVQANDQPRRHPLRNEIAPFSSTSHLEE